VKLPTDCSNASSSSFKSSSLPKVSKSSSVLLTRDASNGTTRYKDRYGWFSHDKPKEQEVSTPPKDSKKMKVFKTPRSNLLSFNSTGGKSLTSGTKWVANTLVPKITSNQKNVEKKKKRRRKTVNRRKGVSVSQNNLSLLNKVECAKARPCEFVNNLNSRTCVVDACRHVTFNSHVNVRTFYSNVFVDNVLVNAYVDSKTCLNAFPKLYTLPVLSNQKGPVFKWVPKIG
jgi:hypothetical protein